MDNYYINCRADDASSGVNEGLTAFCGWAVDGVLAMHVLKGQYCFNNDGWHLRRTHCTCDFLLSAMTISSYLILGTTFWSAIVILTSYQCVFPYKCEKEVGQAKGPI